jgi:uncharacterized protein
MLLAIRGVSSVTQDDRSSLLLPFSILGFLLMIGLIVGGLLLGTKLRDFKRADRYVEVKGLVERTVKSDSAAWTMTFQVSGDVLSTAYAESQKDGDLLHTYLKEHGIKPDEIVGDTLSVNDRITDGNNKGPRFVVSHTISVSTKDVDRVAAANNDTAKLIAEGIILGTNNIIYKFDGLNALKPDMITEATRNARASADRFAADSGSQVGAIREANQGIFSITAANEVSLNDDSGGDESAASIMKKVRVVSTIDYYLVN